MSVNRNNLIIVGEGSVGKSSLVRLLSGQPFNSFEEPTIGVSFRTVDYDCNGLNLKIAIWDASGQRRFEEIVKIYFRDVTAAILVYNITNKKSFKRMNHWINIVREHSNKIKVLSLVGNKIDLRDMNNKMQVTRREGMDFALLKNVLFFETSAKLDINVSELFSTTLTRLMANCAPNTVTSSKHQYKVVVLGDAAVGKTCLIERLADRPYIENTNCTVGTNFNIITREFNNHSIELDIWDTSGQELFDSIMPMYYHGAHAVILVYDITEEKTFKNIPKWIEKLQDVNDINPFILLLGNKRDDEIRRKVNETDGKTFMDRNFVINKFKEVSAKSDHNFDQLINEISVNLIEIFPIIPDQQNIKLVESKKKKNKRTKCC